MDRKDIGSWLQGPKAALEEQGISFGYPGERLGMPETGIGSVARMGRRIVALILDWVAANLIVAAFVPNVEYGSSDFGLAALLVFAAQVSLLTIAIGASFGQQLVGIGVRQVTGAKLGIVPSLVRTVLLTLVFPALIWDRDGRGLHDKLAGSVATKTR